MEEKKRNRKDRRDGWYISDCDVMHIFQPYLIPNRIANEAVMNETIDLTEILKYVEVKNKNSPEFRYTMFHVFVAALAKTIQLRPKLNRFYAGDRYYQRKKLSFSFVVKKQLTDASEEALASITIDSDSDTAPIEQVYTKVRDFVFSVRKDGKTEGATSIMNKLSKCPRWLLRLVMKTLNFLEYHDMMPMSILKEDPYHSSVFISNLGSIKMHASYHHLTNWGTNSIFVVIGEKHKKPVLTPDGAFSLIDTLSLGMTVDERIADGVYFSNSVRLFKKLLENPELLDKKITEPVEY